MAILLRNATNSICHAFNALHQEQTGLVNKSKLKVLTANLATLLDLYGVEKGLDHYRSTSTLSFQHFRFYLTQEVFSATTSLATSSEVTLSQLRDYEAKIDEICWLVCRKCYVTDDSEYTEATIYKLFRIFCMLGVLEERKEEEHCEVRLHAGEVALIVQQLLNALGLDYENGSSDYDYLNTSDELFRFEEFLNLIELRDLCQKTPEYRQSLEEAIEEIFHTYIRDIIKKGFLMRRGYLLPTMREYWFVLQPCELHYYKSATERDLCGTISLDSTASVKLLPSRSDNRVQKFLLTVGDRSFELATSDHRTRMQWIASFQLAITYSAGKEGFQRDKAARRRQQREADRQKRINEELVHVQEAQKTQAYLEREKLARLAAEEAAREDSRRVAELEDIKMSLEQLLEEETQAKRDEEIVRALQARVLSEEWEKREELEQLQEEQRVLLEEERRKRMEFERRQHEKEQQLREAEQKLRELEEERTRLDQELRISRSKIQQSEDAKEALEVKLYSIPPFNRSDEEEEEAGDEEGDSNNNETGVGIKVRRTMSFIPSTKERPVIRRRGKL